MIIAGTGHRPEDCERSSIVRFRLARFFTEVKPDTFITGMASGYDLWAGYEAWLAGSEIWCVKPWAGHKPRNADKELYNFLVDQSVLVINIDKSLNYPGPWVYHKRNHWMVDNCELLLSYWSGKESGGTYECIKYARGRKPIRNLLTADPESVSL